MSVETVPARKRKAGIRHFFRKEDIPLYIMAFPVAAFLIIFCYLPMVGVVMAFQQINIAKGVFASPFVGLKNFEFLFSTTDAYVITRNTVLYNIAYIVVNLFSAVAMALMLSSIRSGRTAKIYQTIYMMPYFLSWTVVQIAAFAFLNTELGLVNKTLAAITGEASAINWYHNRPFWPPFLVFINAWKGVGYQTVLYLAVISGISADYYEAAMIDGASKLKQAWYITIPHLRFVITISLIMAMGSIVRGDFGLHFSVTRNTGMLYPVIDIIDTYIYRSLMNLNNIGMSAAASFYQSTVGLFMILIANWVVTKFDPDSAMF